MTGGRVVILGPTGRNFAAGMRAASPTSGIRTSDFLANCNMGMVELEKVEDDEDIAELRELIEKHRELHRLDGRRRDARRLGRRRCRSS